MNLPRVPLLESTRDKLRWLEDQAAQLVRRPAKPAEIHVRELTLRSLRRLINRMKEELMRAEAQCETT